MRNRGNKHQNGFTYVVVLVALVVIALLAQAATQLDSYTVRADKEQELLFRGQAYQSAIEAYYRAGNRYPRRLQDLLQDPRFHAKKYLRRLYKDPLTRGEWKLVLAPDGGIAGVASNSKQAPLKKGNFPNKLADFDNAPSYSQWIFAYYPQGPSGAKSVAPESAVSRQTL